MDVVEKLSQIEKARIVIGNEKGFMVDMGSCDIDGVYLNYDIVEINIKGSEGINIPIDSVAIVNKDDDGLYILLDNSDEVCLYF